MLVMVSPVVPVLVVAVALVMLVVARDHRSGAMSPTAVLVVVLPFALDHPLLLNLAEGQGQFRVGFQVSRRMNG